ncbi:MAG: hypothetical protein QM820_55130 [Minicystis sp.]
MKRIARVVSLLCLSSVSALASVNCGNSGGTLADGVTVVSQSAVDAVSVEPSRLVFPVDGFADLLQKKSGDILAGDRSETNSKNPKGFLRKVKSVTKTAEGIVVTTAPAVITDAVQDGSFQVTLQTPALAPQGPKAHKSAAPGLGPQGNGDPIKLLDFAGITILDEKGTVDVGDGQSFDFHASAKTTKGNITFTPSWDIGADIGFFKVKEFHAIATGDLSAEVEIDAELDTSTTLDGDALAKLIAEKVAKSTSTTLWDYPIQLGKAHIGPLPIPISAEFKTTLECDFAYGGKVEVVVGAHGEAKITAGLRYEGGDVTPVFDHSEGFGVTGPAWTVGGAVKLRCDVKPRFDIQFYDIASAEIWADAYASVYGAAECGAGKLTGKVEGEAYAGAMAAVHAKVDAFGLFKFDKECTLFDYESPHAMGSTEFPLPGGSGGTCTTGDVTSNDHTDAANPAACFGSLTGNGGEGGSGGGEGGSGGVGGAGGEGGGSTCGSAPAAPAEWTCAPEKYGDCKCDCGCGALDPDCDAGACSTCSHDVCTIGDPLGSDCDACTKKVCAADPYCCDEQWGPSCFLSVEQLCGITCQ